MKLRLMTLKAPLFDHGGMVLDDKRWREIDLEPLGLDGYATVATYRGHIIQIHPEDVAKFDAIAPKVEAAIAERNADRAAAAADAKAKADKADEKDVRRALSEARDELGKARRDAAKNARDALAHADLRARAEDALAEAKEGAATLREQHEALKAEHEQLKTDLAIATAKTTTLAEQPMTPVANADETQSDPPKTETKKK